MHSADIYTGRSAKPAYEHSIPSAPAFGSTFILTPPSFPSSDSVNASDDRLVTGTRTTLQRSELSHFEGVNDVSASLSTPANDAVFHKQGEALLQPSGSQEDTGPGELQGSSTPGSVHDVQSTAGATIMAQLGLDSIQCTSRMHPD
jgi:hypothetical protein